MGYREEKNIVEGKKRNWKKVFACIFAALTLAVGVFALCIPPQEWKYRIKTPDAQQRALGELRMHFLDVGQGDCTLIELPDGKIMLIDGGNGQREVTANILRYINALKIDKIDYLVVTHTDSDHCGGLEEIVKQKEIVTAYLPPIYPEKTHEVYHSFFKELCKQEYAWEYASRMIHLNGVGEYPYVLSFLSPYLRTEKEMKKDEYPSQTNEFSSIVWLDYKGVSTIFMGDAPVEMEEKLIRDDGMKMFDRHGVELRSTEIIKVSHHGSKDATSMQLLNYMHAKSAIVSSGKGNLYGHPNEETLARLRLANVDVHRTDEVGTIIVTVSPTGTYRVDNPFKG
ncbi:MAG: MBL fold metallo-hydrolase [Clostridia bacterium]|nr:MBL fold metallo-hydrolase [Clostridia bacterium]